MANKRKTKTLGKRAQKLRADIQKANVRLRRLEQAGLSDQSDIYNITVNALGHNRFTVPKTKDEEGKLKIILSSFLRGKSTVKGATQAYEQKRIDFENTVRAAAVSISQEAIDYSYEWYEDISIKRLVNEVTNTNKPSEVVAQLFHDIRDSGIDPTAENVRRAIKNSLDYTFEYAIKELPEYQQAINLGVQLDIGELVNSMYQGGIQQVLTDIYAISEHQRQLDREGFTPF